VKWLVEHVLDPQKLEPDPEQLVRGIYVHEVLRTTFERVRRETGTARVTGANLRQAERILLEELRAGRERFQLSPDRTRVRAAMRRLEFDLLRFLRNEAAADGGFEPVALELRFGQDGEDPVELAEGVRVRGRIDRVDRSDGLAVVRDYKSGKSVDSYKAASWVDKNRLQAALYMLVARERLGLRPVAGVYVALGSGDPRPRGLVLKDVPELGSGFHPRDERSLEDFEALLEWARGRIRETAESMRSGALGCNPDSCRFDGKCSYPSICRTES
jgi:ATP-dependent helicase/DNAse subunit B